MFVIFQSSESRVVESRIESEIISLDIIPLDGTACTKALASRRQEMGRDNLNSKPHSPKKSPPDRSQRGIEKVKYNGCSYDYTTKKSGWWD